METQNIVWEVEFCTVQGDTPAFKNQLIAFLQETGISTEQIRALHPRQRTIDLVRVTENQEKALWHLARASRIFCGKILLTPPLETPHQPDTTPVPLPPSSPSSKTPS